MIIIKNLELLSPFILAFSVQDLEWVAGVNLYIKQDKYYENIMIADITFLMKFSNATYELLFRFNNIESFHYQPNGVLVKISGFNIRDLKDHGYHPMKYLVEDYEDGVLGFYCEDIELMSVQESVHLAL
ncbi:hypothetical protein QP794_03460 [Paenibacillus sp. UMB7766-LJ446]|uniref:hypothetical protein n=1 Tax=unclassified Paenibacillus TaxID=185978 RepID=UPI000465E5A0|nr:MULTISPECIES: hypothetical protein [unclassified Paenibacillus]KGP85509.1 hypothetical protein P364_0100380 [Paenibacillus sp. MAEPY2]KGP87272.1 hypothetical protein P363_0113320 [Paenibacillus sp. MAEPY1]MDK8189139.1 hypothetical protein [Paenibacillus sp. UMB7766-LJ446]